MLAFIYNVKLRFETEMTMRPEKAPRTRTAGNQARTQVHTEEKTYPKPHTDQQSILW